MKLKYYLRGLGVGILFSTIILSIAFKSSSKEKVDKVNSNVESNTSGTEAANEDDRIKELEELLAPTTAPSVTPTVIPTVTPTEEGTKDEETIDTTSETPSVTPTVTPAEEETDDANPKESDQTDDSKGKNEGSEDYIIVRIEKGMTSEEVASLLYIYGIIEDKKDFNTYMKKNNYSTIINIGEFKISKNATYEQITDLIVEK